jgi:hypothetical protein
MKPITFRTDMVKAILDGRKSQTRRIIKPQPEHDEDSGYVYWKKRQFDIHEYFWSDQFPRYCPYGKTGDILYVKETWCYETDMGGSNNGWYFYKADFEEHEGPTKWKSNRFMPKAAARIFLEITDIRVERLVEINEEDAIAEGVTNADNYIGLADDSKINRYAYCELWDSINGEGAFELNQWVWVISFKRVEV